MCQSPQELQEQAQGILGKVHVDMGFRWPAARYPEPETGKRENGKTGKRESDLAAHLGIPWRCPGCAPQGDRNVHSGYPDSAPSSSLLVFPRYTLSVHSAYSVLYGDVQSTLNTSQYNTKNHNKR